LNTDALFKSVDADGNGTISEDEWLQFWEEVKKSGHSDDEIRDEVYVFIRLTGLVTRTIRWKFLGLL
jgi:EF hand